MIDESKQMVIYVYLQFQNSKLYFSFGGKKNNTKYFHVEQHESSSMRMRNLKCQIRD
jgi:hypothetical protein